MKIMSLNVNQFRALRLSEGCWAKDIVAFVKRFLSEDNNNVVFLYEVPYYAGAGRNYYGILELFNDFLKEFPSDIFEIHYSTEKAYFCTMAITNKGNKWKPTNNEGGFKVVEEEKEIFKNRFVELVYGDRDDNEKKLRVLGVHASLTPPFLESLTNYIYEVLPMEKSPSRFIVLGDLNCHRGEKSSHQDYLKKMETRLCDLIEDKTVTYFPGGTTIDHVLVSDRLKDSVTAQAIPKVVLELSDHAVIIVDVDL